MQYKVHEGTKKPKYYSGKLVFQHFIKWISTFQKSSPLTTTALYIFSWLCPDTTQAKKLFPPHYALPRYLYSISMVYTTIKCHYDNQVPNPIVWDQWFLAFIELLSAFCDTPSLPKEGYRNRRNNHYYCRVKVLSFSGW